ncbi:MAG: hypothetical protein R3C68_14250 [Myxococcota bacterium]
MCADLHTLRLAVVEQKASAIRKAMSRVCANLDYIRTIPLFCEVTAELDASAEGIAESTDISS